MKSILITGGTGAFGRAFVRRLLNDGQYERICIYSRDEWKQAQMCMKMDDVRLRYFIGDVRDEARLTRAMHGIDVVVHAAALKRIEVGQYNPDEMVKTNVIGTMNAVHAAASAGVKKFITLSSDKAWQPISPYGQSKALTESITNAANNIYGQSGPKYLCTRYGNVFNSTGSVVPVWREQIKQNGHVVITDPECTRFFMWMDESVDLVLHAIEDGVRGDIMIPILPAYRLGDLAEAMRANKQLCKGLPPWEKLHEGMEDGNTSDMAERMTVDQLREALSHA